MKNAFTFAFIGWSLLLGPVAFAQQGAVTYEEVVKIDIQLPPEMEHMRENIPSTQTTMRQLLFNELATLFKNAPQEEENAEAGGTFHTHDGGVVRIQAQRMEDETYVDLDSGQRIEKRDFMGRTFLIDGEATTLPWRLTDERSEFLGHMTQKAIAERDSTTYEAWFTPEIPVSAGPGYGGLPGLILVMNIDDGQRSIVAKELSLEPLEDGLIVAPKKGKKVSQEEFDEIVAEKMKEMNMNSSGGNRTMVIRMRN